MKTLRRSIVNKILVPAMITTILCAEPLTATAGIVEIGPVYIDWLGAIGPSAFGHQPGNMEIKITGGIYYANSPAIGVVTCSADYVTTKASTPNFNLISSV